MLTCYIPPTSGTAVLDKYSILSDPLNVRRVVGYLPENAPLYNEMPAMSFLRFIGRARGMDRVVLKQRLDYVVEVAGLRKVLYKDIGELSKGFRQRLCLAQALLHDPPILILDEPTTGLDPRQRQDIRQLIREIGKTKTVILSTHILPEAEATCDRLVIIHLGKIVGQGTSEELVIKHGKKSRYSLLIRASRKSVDSAFDAANFIREYRYDGRSSEGLMKYEVTPQAPGHEGGESLFRFVSEQGWTLAEMAFKHTTLEDVFRNLTDPTGDNAPKVVA